jgi:hypothetical protein
LQKHIFGCAWEILQQYSDLVHSRELKIIKNKECENDMRQMYDNTIELADENDNGIYKQ